MSGKFPEMYHGDLSKFGLSKISKLQDEINKVVISRILNPKWINGMKDNGYKGAFEFSATLDYLYAFDASTEVSQIGVMRKFINHGYVILILRISF